jgi:V/A-type H+-transporting ATPase subunit K
VKPRLKYAFGLTAVTAFFAAFATLLALGAFGAAAQSASGAPPLADEAVGWALFSAALATGLSSVAAGVAVARVGAAAIGALAERPELFGRLLIFVGLAEGIAIYGLIVSILILNRLG